MSVQLRQDRANDILLILGERRLETRDRVQPLLDVRVLGLKKGGLREDLGSRVEEVRFGGIGSDGGRVRPVQEGEEGGLGGRVDGHGCCERAGWGRRRRRL